MKIRKYETKIRNNTNDHEKKETAYEQNENQKQQLRNTNKTNVRNE